MEKITPCLWFDENAEEAVEFYVSILKNSRIKKVARYGEAGAKASGRPTGSVMTISFQLEGQDFLALNGGPVFTFTPAISLMVNCKTQKEIDELWKKLSADPDAEQCGWLRDKFGVSWQIVPAIIGKMVADENAKRADRVMQAVLQMKKLDIQTLEKAYQGG
jgi:predicted 3-demethylubiquinone-9 3-methyltransferase (glyoxalase superfamily)